ncbi:MAG TPA: FISUMP domain-containing protein [Bacteroidales bacterium]|nr:FISUMP domain-containing protein [Bacteroidales bacterium]
MRKIILLFAGLAFLTYRNQAQTVTDIDGNVYNTVTIGTQVWMRENLKVTHYRNGDSIPNVINNTSWTNSTTGAYCDISNDPSNAVTYGRLYNWYAAVDARKICPAGWHVPSDAEWNKMVKYLDNTADTTITGEVGTDIAAKLKEAGTSHWLSPNTGATNSSGFTALPSGTRYFYGTFSNIGVYGVWWTSTTYSATSAWSTGVDNIHSYILRSHVDKVLGYSVRCICDFQADIEDVNFNDKFQIYPNPATDRVYIDCAERTGIKKMKVFNVIGECILLNDLADGTNMIDISSLTSGVYLIQLIGVNGTLQQKLIKN